MEFELLLFLQINTLLQIKLHKFTCCCVSFLCALLDCLLLKSPEHSAHKWTEVQPIPLFCLGCVPQPYVYLMPVEFCSPSPHPTKSQPNFFVLFLSNSSQFWIWFLCLFFEEKPSTFLHLGQDIGLGTFCVLLPYVPRLCAAHHCHLGYYSCHLCSLSLYNYVCEYINAEFYNVSTHAYDCHSCTDKLHTHICHVYVSC